MVDKQVKGYTRRTKSGRVIQVKAYSQQVDAALESLKTEGRTPITAQPGQFPAGRSTPTTPAIAQAESRIWTARQKALATLRKRQQEAAAAAPRASDDDVSKVGEMLDSMLTDGESGGSE